MNLNVDRCGENGPEPFLVALAQRERDETLCGRRQSAVEEAKHGHNATHYIVNAKILHPQCLQHHAAGVERDEHHDGHPDIEQERGLWI